MNRCKCGADGFTIPVIECSVTRWKVQCCKCGAETQTWMTRESAEAEWNRINRNFPTCETCKHYDISEYDSEQASEYCNHNKTHTEPTWTCPDHLLKDDIKSDAHGMNKNLLDTHFGASASELLQGLTIKKVENRKGDSLSALLWGMEAIRQTDWKAEHDKLAKDYKEDIAELKYKLDEVEDTRDYWYRQWKTAAEENEHLNMLLDKIREYVEGLK